MITLTKEWLQKTIAELEEERDAVPGVVNEDAANALAAMKLALASLEAEPVCVIDQANLDYLKSGSDADVWPASRIEMGDVLLYRAAMLQGADGTLTNEGTIPVTQFKPVADLYGLTSPTGGETSFTFDAVEARDFIDGGWSCQEYVELGRYQEALTDHSEDKLAMVDHSGDSNNMVEPVTTACKLRDAVEIIRNSGIAIDAEKIFAERDALNAPDCWCRTCRPVTFSDSRFVVCPECGNKRCPHANDHRNACTGSNEPGQEGSAYPAAPQQE